MIVITELKDKVIHVLPGDSFNMVIQDETGSEVIISEQITVEKTIDFIASFRFALEDGTVPGFHLMGVFACKSELPVELQNAVMLADLQEDKRRRFIDSFR